MPWPKGNGAGHGGPARGLGWGDGAKGAGTGGQKLGTGGKTHDKRGQLIATEGAERIGNMGAGSGRGHMNDRTQLKRERTEKLEDRLFTIAMTESDVPAMLSIAVQAGTKLHAMYNGTPVAAPPPPPPDEDAAALSHIVVVPPKAKDAAEWMALIEGEKDQ